MRPSDGTEPAAVDRAVGRQIRRIRRERGFTQRNLAVAAKISIVTIRAYELGRLRVPPERLAAIAEILKTRVSAFFIEDRDR